MDEKEVEVEFGTIPDDHVSIWFAPLPEAVKLLVHEIHPHVDLERVRSAEVVPRRYVERYPWSMIADGHDFGVILMLVDTAT